MTSRARPAMGPCCQELIETARQPGETDWALARRLAKLFRKHPLFWHSKNATATYTVHRWILGAKPIARNRAVVWATLHKNKKETS